MGIADPITDPIKRMLAPHLTTDWSKAVGKAMTTPRPQGVVQNDKGVPICPVCRQPLVSEIYIKCWDKHYYPACGCACDTERWRREAAEEAQRRRADAVNRRTASMQSAGKAYSNVALDNDDGKDPDNIAWAKLYIKDWPEDSAKGQGIVFCGPCGTGKTWLAAAVMLEIQRRYGASVLFTSLPSLIEQMHNSKDGGADVLSVVETVDLLVLDDLGTEASTPYRLEKAWHIIDGRYKACKPAIYTTNLTPDTLTNAPTLEQKRLYERVTERNYCRCLTVCRREALHKQLPDKEV